MTVWRICRWPRAVSAVALCLAVLVVPASSAVSAATSSGAPVMVSRPVVSGGSSVGAVLSSTEGEWSGAPSGFGFAWWRCDAAGAGCAPIGTADAGDDADYTLTSADAGHRIRVYVTATNAAGSTTTRSSATKVVAVPVSVSRPVVSGGSSVGAVLSSTAGEWSGDPSGFGFAWWRCDAAGAGCAPIGTADAGDDADYTLTSADAGHRIRVYVTATNAAGSTTTRSSATKVVAVPVLVSRPVVSGGSSVGAVLSSTEGEWSGDPSGFGFAWWRCDAAGAGCAPIGTADAGDDADYTLTSADAGHRIRVYVTATNAAGSTTASSSATPVVGAPVSVSRPVVSGGSSVGAVLS